MITEVSGDLWDVAETAKADAIAIPTNMCVKKNGHAVMGAGVALQALKRYPGIDIELGKWLSKRDPDISKIIIMNAYYPPRILSFPTKNHWKDSASLELIEESALDLKSLCTAALLKTVVMPRVGCGLGQLNWDRVKIVLTKVLDSIETNIVVTSGPTRKM